ncbi:MAG: F0F1 ATP synthase subunit B [Clostridiales bacterium]|nr:F0F1 ATP synthase subunit B [Clostridiales bacterium]
MLYQFILLETESSEGGLFSPEQLGGYLSTAVIAVITVLISFLIIKFLIFKPMIKLLNDRQKLIKDNVEGAEKKEQEAQARIEESKQIIDDARNEAARIVNEAKENAESQANIIISRANEDAQQTLIKADDEVKKIKRSALEEVKDEVTDLAVEVSQKVIGEIVSKETLEELCLKHANQTLDAEVNKINAEQ